LPAHLVPKMGPLDLRWKIAKTGEACDVDATPPDTEEAVMAEPATPREGRIAGRQARAALADAAARPAGRAPATSADLAALVGTMNRFLGQLAQLSPFGSKLELAEWLVLSIISQKGGLTRPQISKELGISEQRVNDLCEVLKTKKMILLTRLPRGPNADTASLTDAGADRVKVLQVDLAPILAKIRTNLLASFNMRLSNLLELIGKASQPSETEERESEAPPPDEDEPVTEDLPNVVI
jgi:DNA-binding MarR family transcriptional regulator